MKREQSEKAFALAKTLFPGGVNSPVRAFKSVGGNPIFFRKEKDRTCGTSMAMSILIIAALGDL